MLQSYLCKINLNISGLILAKSFFEEWNLQLNVKIINEHYRNEFIYSVAKQK